VIGTTPKGKHRPRKSPSPDRRASVTTGVFIADGKKKRGFFRRFWWMFVLVPLLAIVGFIGTIAYVYAHTDIPYAGPGPQTTYVYDRHGHLLDTLHAGVNRTLIPLSKMPKSLQQAVIAIEDKNYYHEGGVSYFGILRAGWANLRKGEIQQGGSTIAQQYVKNVYTGSERTFARKIKEAILAVKLSHKYSKDEILERYLNTVYFGNGAYGVQAAAQTYWHISASGLTPVQSATLAGLIAAPSHFDPVKYPDAARDRRNIVLSDMAEQGYLSPAEAAELKSHPVKVDERDPQLGPKSYFGQYVSQRLQETYGDATFTAGLRVTTTLDRGWQAAAERAIAEHLPNPKDPAAALVAIDPRNGQIRAMVGGRDFAKSKFNLAVNGLGRQAGSAFKPFTLAAAMEQKISLNSVWSGPSSIEIPDKRCYDYAKGEPWTPHNAADEESGTFTLAQATAHSVNTVFAQVVTTVGPASVVDMAHRAGIDSDLQPVCSITLGSQGVHPLEMADAYATFAARGVHHDPISIAAVKNPSGSVIHRASTKGTRVMRQNNADLVTYALEGVIRSGTGTAAAIDWPDAGKTGTAQNYQDAWFCGYTAQLTTCVWMGYPRTENRPMVNVEGVYHVFGGTIPAAIWHDFMTAAMKGQPAVDFPTPSFSGYDTNPEGAIIPEPSPPPSPSPPPTPTPGVIPSDTPKPPKPKPSHSHHPKPSPSALPSAP
jgi:penicillin-binding protein 1A